jgi:hypothetical protein
MSEVDTTPPTNANGGLNGGYIDSNGPNPFGSDYAGAGMGSDMSMGNTLDLGSMGE